MLFSSSTRNEFYYFPNLFCFSLLLGFSFALISLWLSVFLCVISRPTHSFKTSSYHYYSVIYSLFLCTVFDIFLHFFLQFLFFIITFHSPFFFFFCFSDFFFLVLSPYLFSSSTSILIILWFYLSSFFLIRFLLFSSSFC